MHVTFGIAAFCAGSYFAFSEAISMGLPSLDPSYRVRLFVTGAFAFSAYSLSWRSWRPDRFGYVIAGYSSAAVGALGGT